ncbi:hypothetical protein C8J56DRAFT_1030177 [Mycena floridula]|nr:hypothetical protein C8J56DRAFT_1030177 [Mycena floridula]
MKEYSKVEAGNKLKRPAPALFGLPRRFVTHNVTGRDFSNAIHSEKSSCLKASSLLKLDEIFSNLNSRLTPIVDNTKLASLGLGAAQSKALVGYSGSEMQREIRENEEKGLWMVSTELACFSTERPPTNWCIEDGKPFRSPRGSRLAILSVSQKSWPYTSRRMTRDSRAFNEEELEGTARAESKGFRFISDWPFHWFTRSFPSMSRLRSALSSQGFCGRVGTQILRLFSLAFPAPNSHSIPSKWYSSNRIHDLIDNWVLQELFYDEPARRLPNATHKPYIQVRLNLGCASDSCSFNVHCLDVIWFLFDNLEFSPKSLGPSSTAEAHLGQYSFVGRTPLRLPGCTSKSTPEEAQDEGQAKLPQLVLCIVEPTSSSKHCSLRPTISAAGNLEETCSSTSSNPLGITVVLVAGGCAVQILGDIRGEANCRDTRSNEISLVIVGMVLARPSVLYFWSLELKR